MPADVNQHHILVEAVEGADMPALQQDAASWCAMGGNAVPGRLVPEMVLMTDLLDRADGPMAEELSREVEANEVDPFDHMSEFFGRLRKKTPIGECNKLVEIGAAFFGRFNEQLDVVAALWPLLLKWRHRRVLFAHPQLGNSTLVVDPQLLCALAGAITTQPVYGPVKDAAAVLVKVVEEQVAAAQQAVH